jgi:hypothetical protein
VSLRPPDPDAVQSLLDRVFERALERVEDGRSLRLADFIREHDPLAPRIQELFQLAREVAFGPPVIPPAVRGYEILAELRCGPGRAVYLARREARPDQLAVLRWIALPPGQSPAFRDRIRELLERAAAVACPNLRLPYAASEGTGGLVLESAWTEGASLAELIARFAIPRTSANGRSVGSAHRAAPPLALPAVRDVSGFVGAPPVAQGAIAYAGFVCRLGVTAARALAVAHGAGLVHGELAPADLIIDLDGAPVLSGFLLDAELARQVAGFDGECLHYTAPEVLRGAAPTSSSDVYSLGAVLYHALAGCAPFEAANAVETLRRILTGRAAPLASLNRDLPQDLVTVIATAMNPETHRRYASADTLADDLERLLALRSIRARPPHAAARAACLLRRNFRAVVGLAIAAAIGLLLLALSR